MACHCTRRIDARPGADGQRQDPGGVPGLPGSLDVRAFPERRCDAGCAVSPLKALAVDVERNLRAPIAGISACAATRSSSLTSHSHRRHAAAIGRGSPAPVHPDHHARVVGRCWPPGPRALASIDTVIVDEIHSLMPTKRGAHLAIRWSGSSTYATSVTACSGYRPPCVDRRGHAISRGRPPVPAAAPAPHPTHPPHLPPHANPLHPCDEFADGVTNPTWRPSRSSMRATPRRSCSRWKCRLSMARVAQSTADIPSGPASQVPSCVDLDGDPPAAARADSRLSVDAALREQPQAGRAPGGRAQRARGRDARRIITARWRASSDQVEDLLKGVASARSSRPRRWSSGSTWAPWTSSSDRGAAFGRQRLRSASAASHQVDAASTGVIFPKFRGDLVACAAVTEAMHAGASRRPAIRATRATCWRSRSWRWWRSTTGRSTTIALAARGARARQPRFRACSTCCRGAIHPTNSPSCGPD